MKTVVITGGTGALGSALTPLFLQEPGTAVRLIVRASSPEHARQRLGKLLAFWDRDAPDPLLGERIEAVPGDVSLPRLGLSAQDHARLCAEATHLIHAAGDVKLNQSLEHARKTAVDSARYVIDFTQECRRHGQFRKLEFLSTVGVAGRTCGLIPETPLTHPRSFHNTYEAAKAEAESLLLDQIHGGLPATIHRPSMVVGDSQTGKIIRFQVFYHLCEFFVGRKTWGVTPETGDVRLDIIPVDFVAQAIHIASRREDTAGRILHLCSGPQHAWPIARLTERLREIFADHGEPLPRLYRLSPRLMRRLIPLVSPLVSEKRRRVLQGLPYFLDYLEENQVFDNAQSQKLFNEEGLVIPAVEDYLQPLIDYYRRGKAAQGKALEQAA